VADGVNAFYTKKIIFGLALALAIDSWISPNPCSKHHLEPRAVVNRFKNKGLIVGAEAVRFKEMYPTVAFCTTSPFTNPLLKLFENGEGVQLGLLVVTLLCGTASRLASSLRWSLHPGRWSFGPGVTCCSPV